MTRVASLTPVLVLAAACRIGGPSGDPSTYIDLADASGDQVAEGGPEPTGDDGAGDSGSSIEAAGGDAAAAPDVADSAAEAGDASDGGAATACAPPSSVPVCNPVQNTGCFLLQCDVDMTKVAPTGQCVGGGLSATGASCTPVSGSESCQAQSTCFGGTCRRLCFCDSDCAGGECCTDTAGTSGFKLCAACH